MAKTIYLCFCTRRDTGCIIDGFIAVSDEQEAKRWVKNRKYAIETGITNFGDAFYEPIEVDNMRGWSE